MVINIPAGCVHAFSFLPGTRGWVIALATEVLGCRQVVDDSLSFPEQTDLPCRDFTRNVVPDRKGI